MDKRFSRKGAKPSRKVAKKNLRTKKGCPLRLCGLALRLCVKPFLVSVLILSLTGITTFSQKNPVRFNPDGQFWILGDTPHDFSEFGAINLNAKRSRQLPPQGFELNNGKRVRFKTLTVKRDNFTFTTFEIGGASYAFSGKFLKGGVYSAGDLDDTIPVLKGTLTKFRNGQKVAEANLTFSYFGGT
jgi:hypothetical protein